MLTLHPRSLPWLRALLGLSLHTAGQRDTRHHVRARISKTVEVPGHLACRSLLCNGRHNNIWLQQTNIYFTACEIVQQLQLVVHMARRKIGDGTFSIAVPHDRNRPPTESKLARFTTAFKRHQKAYLFCVNYNYNHYNGLINKWGMCPHYYGTECTTLYFLTVTVIDITDDTNTRDGSNESISNHVLISLARCGTFWTG